MWSKEGSLLQGRQQMEGEKTTKNNNTWDKFMNFYLQEDTMRELKRQGPGQPIGAFLTKMFMIPDSWMFRHTLNIKKLGSTTVTCWSALSVMTSQPPTPIVQYYPPGLKGTTW